MAAKVLSFVALVACMALMAEAKPQLLVAPVATVTRTAALSAHPLPGTPFVSGYSHQAIHHVSRSALVAAPVVHAAPYVSAPYVSSPYLSSPYVSSPYVAAPYYL